MTMTINRFARFAGLSLMAGTLVIAGCDDVTDELLEVRDPDTVSPETLQDPSTLPFQVNGAIDEFVSGYSGGGDAFISTTALMSDEFFSSGTFTTRTATDRRDQFGPQNGNTTDGPYGDLHDARRATRSAAVALENFASTSDPRWSEMRSLEAMATLALAEAYCPAIPLSEVNPEAPESQSDFLFGQPLSGAAVMQRSIQLADEAIAAGGASLPAVVKGRALLDLGQFAAAASAVSAVPTDFVYFTFHSNSAQDSPIFGLQDNGRYSMGDNEGINGLPYRTDGFAPAGSREPNETGDPRIPWFRPDDKEGFDGNIPLFMTLRYVDDFSPIAVATGVEARLIEAEAALNAGDVSGMLTILNDMRADVANLMDVITDGIVQATTTLDPLTDPGTAAARVDMLFKERAYWLHLTGRRMPDLRRLVNQYGRAAESVYPTGNYFKGGVYGTDVNFFLAFEEETNNPNVTSIEAICDVGTASFGS
ncbi:MAG: hypothetical protein RQ745_03565 [Longimicrobiales bacterium]|nr:hypothetical protein [Longimicrobiales bacterium]